MNIFCKSFYWNCYKYTCINYLCIITDCCPCPEHNTTNIFIANSTVLGCTFSIIKQSSQSIPSTLDISSLTILLSRFLVINKRQWMKAKHLFLKIMCSPSPSLSNSPSLISTPCSDCEGNGSVYAKNWPKHSRSLGRGWPPNKLANNWIRTFFVLGTFISFTMYSSLGTNCSSLIVRKLCVLCAVSVASSNKCSRSDFINPPGAFNHTSRSHIKS